MQQPVMFSIIISAKNEEEHISRTINSMVNNLSVENFEIIVINDGSTDKTEQILGNLKIPYVKTIRTNSLGTAKARNMGFRFAKGEIIIFSDAHITVPDRWLEHILKANEEINFDVLSVPIGADERGIFTGNEVVGYGQTLNAKLDTQWLLEQPLPYTEVPIAAGGFVVFNKKVFQDIGGFDTGFPTWGYEDVEISIKAWLRGYKIRAITDFFVDHYFRKTIPFRVSMEDFAYNHLRTAYLHLSFQRIEKLKTILHKKFEEAYEHTNIGFYNAKKSMERIQKKIDDSSTLKDREEYFKKRKYSDDWFFSKFNILF